MIDYVRLLTLVTGDTAYYVKLNITKNVITLTSLDIIECKVRLVAGSYWGTTLIVADSDNETLVNRQEFFFKTREEAEAYVALFRLHTRHSSNMFFYDFSVCDGLCALYELFGIHHTYNYELVVHTINDINNLTFSLFADYYQITELLEIMGHDSFRDVPNTAWEIVPKKQSVSIKQVRAQRFGNNVTISSTGYGLESLGNNIISAAEA